MARRKAWDKRYPPRETSLKNPGDFEAWIVGSYNRLKGYSACAWEIRPKGANEPALEPEAYRSAEPNSALHRPYIAALVGVVQTLPPKSTVHFVCELEWIVNILNGTHSFGTHEDIWEAFTYWSELRDIRVTASTWSSRPTADKKIFARLKKLVTKVRKGE